MRKNQRPNRGVAQPSRIHAADDRLMKWLSAFFYLASAILLLFGQFLFWSGRPRGIAFSILAVVAAIIPYSRQWIPTSRHPFRFFQDFVVRPGGGQTWTDNQPSPADISPFARPNLIAAAFLALFVAALLRYPLVHPALVMNGFDMAIYFPFKMVLAQTIRAGHPALWNPFSSLGSPFMPYSQVGFFSPFNLLNLIFPQSYAMTLRAFFGFLILSYGTFLLARTIGSGWAGGFLAAMAFSFGGYFMSRILQSQAILLWSGCYMPWVLYFLTRAILERKTSWLLLGSLSLALSFFEGHPQMVYYTLLFSGFFLLYALVGGLLEWKRTLAVGSLFILAFLALISCQLLPMFDFMSKSDRWHWGYQKIMNNYLFPRDLQFFINPFFEGSPRGGFRETHGGYHELANYLGLVPVVFLLAGFFYIRKIRFLGFFYATALLFTCLALGDSTPWTSYLFKFFYHFVPGIGDYRAPGRIMVLSDLSLACAAGLMLKEWGSGMSPAIWKGWKRVRAPWPVWLALLLAIANTWWFADKFISTGDPSSYVDRSAIFPDRVWDRFVSDDPYARIYPSNEICANIPNRVSQIDTADKTYINDSSYYLKELQDNYDSQLSDLVDLKYMYNDVLYSNPSARWQPFPGFKDYVINHSALPRTFITGGFEVTDPDMAKAVAWVRKPGSDIRGNVLLNRSPGFASGVPGGAGTAEITDYDFNRVAIRAHADRPGVLFLSDAYFDGWSATLNGKKTPILKADGLFRAVGLPAAGDYLCQMSYYPRFLNLGLSISFLALFLIMVALARGWNGPFREAPLAQKPLRSRT